MCPLLLGTGTGPSDPRDAGSDPPARRCLHLPRGGTPASRAPSRWSGRKGTWFPFTVGPTGIGREAELPVFTLSIMAQNPALVALQGLTDDQSLKV